MLALGARAEVAVKTGRARAPTPSNYCHLWSSFSSEAAAGLRAARKISLLAGSDAFGIMPRPNAPGTSRQQETGEIT